MNGHEFRHALSTKLKFANANINDVLDERNDNGYWLGYKMALIELMALDVTKTYLELNK